MRLQLTLSMMISITDWAIITMMMVMIVRLILVLID